jgi:hypothetical protein
MPDVGQKDCTSSEDGGQTSGRGSPATTETRSPGGGPLLSSDLFQSPEYRDLQDAIDQLRVCGVGRQIQLPQVRRMQKIFFVL